MNWKQTLKDAVIIAAGLAGMRYSSKKGHDKTKSALGIATGMYIGGRLSDINEKNKNLNEEPKQDASRFFRDKIDKEKEMKSLLDNNRFK